MGDVGSSIIPYEADLPEIKDDNDEFDERREGEEKRYRWLFYAFWIGYGVLHAIIFIWFGIWPIFISILGHVVAVPIMSYFIRVPEVTILQTTLREDETTLVRITRVAAGALREFKMVGGKPANLQMEDGSRVIIANDVNLNPQEGRKTIRVPFSARFAWYELYANEHYVREFTEAFERSMKENAILKAERTAGIVVGAAELAGKLHKQAYEMPPEFSTALVKVSDFEASQSTTLSDKQAVRQRQEVLRKHEPKGIQRYRQGADADPRKD